ncbi:MAG: autotransporter outer membrane beta-barrel domain-containing protein [Sulfuritalea sp.]|nr:autotransporter outer membrane beta-barrel domain-containing protein [Sulfuritalea sp.]
MIKQIRFVFAAGVLAIGSSSAFAQSSACSSIQSLIASGSCTGTCITSYQTNHPECFGSTSSTAGASQSIGITTVQQMLTISNAASARFTAFQTPGRTVADAGQSSGLAAGSASSKWNVWGALSDDHNKYDGGTVANKQIKSDLNVTNVVLGADYLLSPTLAFGASVAFDRGNGTGESINAGVSNGQTTSTTSGYTIAPYLAWSINKDLSLDGTIGWGDSDLSSSGNLAGSSKRFFYGANLNYTHWYGNWQVTGKGSYLYGEEKFGDLTTNGATMANTATKNKLDQWRLGAQAGYWMNGVMPYFGLSYSTDGRSTSADAATQAATDDLGKSAWLWSLGVNFISLKNSMTGGIVYNQESGRSHGKRDNLMANINVRF